MPPTTSQAPAKKKYKCRLLRGQYVQNGRRLPPGRDGVGANEYEHEIFNPGDVFESEIDLSKFDKNSAEKKFEKVHPATPCCRKKQFDKPQAEQWAPDQEVVQAPGETLDMYIQRLQNIKKLREELLMAEHGEHPLRQEDLDQAEEERQREFIRHGITPPSMTEAGNLPYVPQEFGDDPGNAADASFAGFVPPPCPSNGNEENAPFAKAVRREPTRVGDDGQPVATMTPEERFNTLNDMTVNQLKGYARDLNVDLGRVTRHDDIVKLLMAATDVPQED